MSALRRRSPRPPRFSTLAPAGPGHTRPGAPPSSFRPSGCRRPRVLAAGGRKIARRCARREGGGRGSESRRGASPRGGGGEGGTPGEGPRQAAAIASLPLMEIVKIGDSPPEKLAGRSAAVGRPRARPDAGPRRADLRPHARRARRRRLEDHRGASAEYRLPGIRHRPRQALRPSRSARAEGRRDPARAGPRDRRVLARLPAGHPGQSRFLARGARACGPASSSSRCAPSAMSGRGRRAAASTRWCRRSAASPAARVSCSPARRRARSSIRCRRSTI